jgi:hypothetical protein
MPPWLPWSAARPNVVVNLGRNVLMLPTPMSGGEGSFPMYRFRADCTGARANKEEDCMRVLMGAFVVSIPLVLVVACGNSDTTPQPTAPTAAYGTNPPGYPPPAQGQPPPGYPAANYPPGYATAAPQYPAPSPAPYPAPSPAPVPTYTAAPVATYAPPTPVAPSTPVPAATATMATPGLLALPCQSDAACGLHHCNTQYGKCAFPCQAAVDCVSNNCVMGVCFPGNGP